MSKEIKFVDKGYYKCECGSEDFLKVYTVYDLNCKVAVSTMDGEEYWDEETNGVSKDHLDGYRCKGCGQDAQELNDGL